MFNVKSDRNNLVQLLKKKFLPRLAKLKIAYNILFTKRLSAVIFSFIPSTETLASIPSNEYTLAEHITSC